MLYHHLVLSALLACTDLATARPVASPPPPGGEQSTLKNTQDALTGVGLGTGGAVPFLLSNNQKAAGYAAAGTSLAANTAALALSRVQRPSQPDQHSNPEAGPLLGGQPAQPSAPQAHTPPPATYPPHQGGGPSYGATSTPQQIQTSAQSIGSAQGHSGTHQGQSPQGGSAAPSQGGSPQGGSQGGSTASSLSSKHMPGGPKGGW
ncbi:hypothetical protein OIDMADRAFT_30765 [Oidiodendron maius Zn]|uniref:Uncharacterized protein n=1 Tax=Oidiodendron maius (strain Zn) TaxID=913774 RepID=A0A0C3GT17_OIDMZ|nr:hypothetical protein OIDMADRAFT_30765 [Oidiodendron maius Zn]